MRGCMARRVRSRELTSTAALAALLLAVRVSIASAGIIEPELSVTGEAGIPGGTVSVNLSLADDIDNVAVSAGIDLVFPIERLTFEPPVTTNCAVDPRIADTHGIAGRLLNPGVLNLEIFALVTPPPPPPLGNGVLATCDFRINDFSPLGPAALEIESPFLGNDVGMQIPARIRNGSVEVLAELPTNTPTVTNTPQHTPTVTATGTRTATATFTTMASPTATASQTATDTPETPAATSTPTVTRTNTRPTATATATLTSTTSPQATNTPPPTVTRTAASTATPTRKKSSGGGGCNVSPTAGRDPSAALALLLAPALLIWARRRKV